MKDQDMVRNDFKMSGADDMYEFMEANGMFGVKHIQTGECFLISNRKEIVEELLEMIRDSDVEPIHIPDLVYDLLYDKVKLCEKK